MTAIQILFLSLIGGIILLFVLIKTIREGLERRFIRELQKRGKIVTGQIANVDILINKWASKGTRAERRLYGKVLISFWIGDLQYFSSQTTSKELALSLLNNRQTEVQVVYLPENPEKARLAQACNDYLALTF